MKIKDKAWYYRVVYKLARFGCYSLGIVYVLVGGIAISSLFKMADDAADEERIIYFLLDLPLGWLIILFVVIGLTGYIIWRLFEAFTDPYDFGNAPEGLMKRAGVAISAGAYGAMAYSTVNVAIEKSGGMESGEASQQLMVGQVLEWWAGSWLVGAAGLITFVVGLVQFRFVIQGQYNKRLDINHFTSLQKKGIHTLAYAGYFARGIILLILGYFLFKAGINSNPYAVGDTDSAFDFIGGGLFGNIMFFLVALGTACYGFLMFVLGSFYKFRKG